MRVIRNISLRVKTIFLLFLPVLRQCGVRGQRIYTSPIPAKSVQALLLRIAENHFAMGSSYRDRTSEFRLLSETLRKIGGVSVANQAGADPTITASKPAPTAITRSEFNKKASRIGVGIHETSQKIGRLAQCMWLPHLSSPPPHSLCLPPSVCVCVRDSAIWIL